jgi:antitoxin PrlF
MPTATLTSKGQTVIPKAIRDHLGLHPGDALDFVVQDNGDVLIRPATEDIRRLKGLLHRPGGDAGVGRRNIAANMRETLPGVD